MPIANKTKLEILNDENLNNSFLNANLNDLKINCKIYKGNFYCDSFNYLPITEKMETFEDLYNWQVDNSISHFYSKEFLDYFNKNKQNFPIIENAYVLGSSPGDNYYTNLLYFLPRIFFNDEKEIRLCVHRNLSNKFRSYISEICKNLNKKINFVFLDDNFYFFKNSKIPEFLSIEKSKKILNYFNNHISSNVPANLKIYLSRQNVGYRNIINEDDVIKLLKKYNYRILDLNNLEIKEQLNFFINADTIISPTGSSLANAIFCNPGTTILEIAPTFNKEYEKNLSIRYAKLCSSFNLNHLKINADTIKVNNHSGLVTKYISKEVLNESSYYSDLIVKINELKNFLD